MPGVYVEPDYLGQLADETEEAAAKIEESKTEVAGRGMKLIWDHGIICSSCARSLIAAEMERENACNAMIGVINSLAENLRASANAYVGTDTQSGQNLDQQVLPS